MDYDYLLASDGTGDAALMRVNAVRSSGSTVIHVDTVSGVSAKFLGSYGTLGADGFITPSTLRSFKGHTSSGTLVIDAFEPGSTDNGNLEGDVVVIRPNTGWTNRVATVIQAITGFGSAIAGAFTTLTATSLTTTADVTVGGNIAITGTSKLTSASIASASTITPTKQIYNVTALATSATINVPNFTAADGIQGEIQILDNGTAQNLTWAAGWLAIGVTFPTSTTAGKFLYVTYRYNAADSKFHVRGVARQS